MAPLRALPCVRMRVWIDLTNSPHVLVMRPVIERLRAAGHEVQVTSRDYAQTIALCERLGIAHTPIGRHRGERLAAKASGLVFGPICLLAVEAERRGWVSRLWCSVVREHHSPLTPPHSPFHHPPPTTHHAPLTTHHSEPVKI